MPIPQSLRPHFGNGEKRIIQKGPYKGEEYIIEAYATDLLGFSPWENVAHIASLKYVLRAKQYGLPKDDLILYGKIGGMGEMIHITELEA